MATSKTDAGEPALFLGHLTKRFGATLALDDVDLTIGKGEVVALLGANGAGKSTLAKIASGVYQPDGGTVVVNGNAVRFTSPRNARKAGIVTVHQATDQLGVSGISVAENLVLDDLCGGGFGAMADLRRIRKRAAAIAAHVDLEIPLDSDFGVFGPAQRQLIAIARAVAARAPVLILDEPTASLGAAEAERLFVVVDRLRAQGVGVLYISHRMKDIRRIADRVVVLRNGRVVYSQARPFDLAVSIRHMIGRELGTGDRPESAPGDGAPLVRLAGMQLVPGAKPFDLDIRKGEIVALTGALGSGKSRLLGTLFGTTRAASGRITIEGEPWEPRGPAHSIVSGVFLAAEDRWRSSLLPPLTPGGDIAGTIALPYRRRWFPFGPIRGARERAVADKAIATLGIRCRGATDTLDLLSGGNQQKVVIGRWQVTPCRLLLLDEPFQGVDVGARHDLVDAVRSGQHDGATLIATSDVEEAIEAADRIAVMHEHTVVGLHDLRAEGSGSLFASLGAIEAGAARI
jgi:simple sugar transport system ATP-binding protein